MNIEIKKTIGLCFFLLAFQAEGVVVKFPDQDLAPESVLPLFNPSVSVRNRNIVNAKKIEVGGFIGASLIEPFYNQSAFGLNATYHLNERHAIHSSFFYWLSGLTDQAKTLGGTTLQGGDRIDLSKAPSPQAYFVGEYQYTPFYGKISVDKNYVINTHIYGLVGGGYLITGGQGHLTLNLGFGYKFYLLKSLALRFDLRGIVYNGINPLNKKGGGAPLGKDKELSISVFETHIIYSTLLSSGLSYHF